MAGKIDSVEKLLEELREPSFKAAELELENLNNFANKNGFNGDNRLKPWDISYWSELLRKEKLNLDQEALRPWFPLEDVLQGLFRLFNSLSAALKDGSLNSSNSFSTLSVLLAILVDKLKSAQLSYPSSFDCLVLRVKISSIILLLELSKILKKRTSSFQTGASPFASTTLISKSFSHNPNNPFKTSSSGNHGLNAS